MKLGRTDWRPRERVEFDRSLPMVAEGDPLVERGGLKKVEEAGLEILLTIGSEPEDIDGAADR